MNGGTSLNWMKSIKTNQHDDGRDLLSCSGIVVNRSRYSRVSILFNRSYVYDCYLWSIFDILLQFIRRDRFHTREHGLLFFVILLNLQQFDFIFVGPNRTLPFLLFLFIYLFILFFERIIFHCLQINCLVIFLAAWEEEKTWEKTCSQQLVEKVDLELMQFVEE